MEIVFREHANAKAGQKFLSLFPGLGYAAGYKGTPSRTPPPLGRSLTLPRLLQSCSAFSTVFAQIFAFLTLSSLRFSPPQASLQGTASLVAQLRRILMSPLPAVRWPAVLQRLLEQERQGDDGRDCGIVRSSPTYLMTSRSPPAYSLTGIGEIVLLPLDVLKIKRQYVYLPLPLLPFSD
jgi:hypothetical protein